MQSNLNMFKGIINELIEVFLPLNQFRAYNSVNENVKLIFDNVEIRVPIRLIRKDLRKEIFFDFHYFPIQAMNERQLLTSIKKVLESRPHLFLSRTYLFKEVSQLESLLLKKNSRRRVKKDFWSKYKVKGKVHFIKKERYSRLLLVSNHPANDRSLYEKPMLNLLSRSWPFGRLLNNFCAVRLNRKGVKFLFEIDAVSFRDDSVFMIEIKNKNSPPVKELVRKFTDAAHVLNEWRKSLGSPITKMYPFIYYRVREGVDNSHSSINNDKTVTKKNSFHPSFAYKNQAPLNNNGSKFDLEGNERNTGKIVNYLFLEEVKKMVVDWNGLVFYPLV